MIGCSAHFFNNMIERSLCIPNLVGEDIQRLFNNIHDIVVYLRSSHYQCELSVKGRVPKRHVFGSKNYDLRHPYLESALNSE